MPPSPSQTSPPPRRELGSGALVRVLEYRCTAVRGQRGEPEAFGFAAISLVRSGVFGFRSAGGHQLLGPGFALLANPGQQYEVSHEHAGGDRCLIFRFEDLEALERVVGSAPTQAPRQLFARSVLPPLPRAELLGLLAEQRLGDGTPLGLEELGLSLARQVAAQLGRAGEPARSHRRDRDRLHAALDLIERCSALPLSLADLARTAGLAPSSFLRLFRRHLGVTPHRFLLQARIRRAVVRLRDTGDTVTEIAYGVGFGDLSNFINTFRQELGRSPARFRRETFSRPSRHPRSEATRLR